MALHLLVAWFMPSVLRALAARPHTGAGSGAIPPMGSASCRPKWVDWLGLPGYHAMMVLVIPALLGYAPFSRRLSAGRLWRALVASL